MIRHAHIFMAALLAWLLAAPVPGQAGYRQIWATDVLRQRAPLAYLHDAPIRQALYRPAPLPLRAAGGLERLPRRLRPARLRHRPPIPRLRQPVRQRPPARHLRPLRDDPLRAAMPQAGSYRDDLRAPAMGTRNIIRVASPYGNAYRRPAFRPRRKLPPAFRPPRTPPRQATTPQRGLPAPAARRIAPSQALRKVLRVIPGSMGLGVELLPGVPPVYAVKLKTGSRIRRVLVDAVSGRVLDR